MQAQFQPESVIMTAKVSVAVLQPSAEYKTQANLYAVLGSIYCIQELDDSSSTPQGSARFTLSLGESSILDLSRVGGHGFCSWHH